MALSPEDRKAFSLKIVSSDDEVVVFKRAKEQLIGESAKLQKLDDANKNLFDPFNTLINQYQVEFASLDGNVRSTFTEQNILDAAAVKLQNYFYPNDTSVTVPSLSSNHNVWVKAKPFAGGYAVGLNYSQAYPAQTTKEGDLINAVLTLITSAASYSNIQNTTGLHLTSVGTCSLSQYTDQATCETNMGVWTQGPETLTSFGLVQTLKSDLVTAVNNLIAFLTTEATQIVTTDKDSAATAQNNAAISNINSVIKPALANWLSYSDFHTTSAVNSFNFTSYDASLLGPTKLNSTQLSALQSALNTRLAFISTRVSQLNTILGSISQDLTSGDTTYTGLYGRRYGFLLLRLDILNGSLNKLSSMNSGLSAQDSIISSIKQNKQTYMSILPTTTMNAPGNGTSTVQVADASFLAPGDTVYLMSEGQEELQRAIKSISGTTVVLNDIVPTKYTSVNKFRLYKDQSQ